MVAQLSRVVYVVLLVVLAGMVVGAKAKPAGKKAAPPKGSQAGAPAPLEVWPPRIPLQRDLRFTIRPTLLGLVPPGDPAGFGECFVRVTGTAPLTVHYEIKEQHETKVGSRPVDVTAIRRGEVAVLQQAPQLAPPLLWTTGDFNAAGGLLWLQPAQYAALKSTGMAPHDLSLPLAHGNTQLAGALNAVVAARAGEYGLAEGAPTQLIVQDWQASYPAYVNGRRADLPALRCTDSVRLAMYWILDDPENPLLLKMTYIAPSLAEAEPPVPAVKVEGGERKVAGEEVLKVVETSEDAAEKLINAGGGFAVINLDY
jgi:hypothetical protein